MLNVEVQKVTFMSLGDNNEFTVDVDLSQTKERARLYTDLYILIKLTIPILINNNPQLMSIQKQFLYKVKDINVSDYILRGLILEWPGQLDEERLSEALKGKAAVQFFNISDIAEEGEYGGSL